MGDITISQMEVLSPFTSLVERIIKWHTVEAGKKYTGQSKQPVIVLKCEIENGYGQMGECPCTFDRGHDGPHSWQTVTLKVR